MFNSGIVSTNRSDSSVNTEIISAHEYTESLRQKYAGIEFPFYKLRQWFARSNQVFFDCEDSEKQACLEKTLKDTKFDAFSIFFVVKDAAGAFKFMDASFRNIGTETLEHFVVRFHSQLESMTKLGVQASGSEYIECIGHSYIEATHT